MSFAYPIVLAGLLALPLLLALWLVPRARRRRLPTMLFSRTAFAAAAVPRTLRVRLSRLPEILTVVALGLLIVAAARPREELARPIEVEGIDIYLALDMSGSMRAIDGTPRQLRALERLGRKPANRFENAIETLSNFVQAREHDRIGMVVFAADAFLQFPLTLDYDTILSMLRRLELGDINESGTAIGNAIGRAIAGLKESDARTKIIILITDGDRRGGNISPRQAAEMAADLGIQIFPILVGGDGNSLVPVGRDPFSGRTSYRAVEFPTDPELLQDIAEMTDGAYYRASAPEELREGLHQILDRFERSRLQATPSVDYDERYRPWVLYALVALIAAALLRLTWLRDYP